MVQPEKRFKVRGCTASVFANELNTPNGTTVVKTVVLQRTYRDNDGNFQHTANFRANDIPKAILALNKAYDYLTSDEKAE